MFAMVSWDNSITQGALKVGWMSRTVIPRHTTDDHVRNPNPTAVPFGYQLRGERRPDPGVANSIDPTSLAHGFGGETVAGIPRPVPGPIVFVVAVMLSQLGLQTAFSTALISEAMSPPRPGQPPPDRCGTDQSTRPRTHRATATAAQHQGHLRSVWS